MRFSFSDGIFIYSALGTISAVQGSTKIGEKIKVTDIFYTSRNFRFLEDFFSRQKGKLSPTERNNTKTPFPLATEAV